MKDYTKEEMIQIYKNRRSKLADYLKKMKLEPVFLLIVKNIGIQTLLTTQINQAMPF